MKASEYCTGYPMDSNEAAMHTALDIKLYSINIYKTKNIHTCILYMKTAFLVIRHCKN